MITLKIPIEVYYDSQFSMPFSVVLGETLLAATHEDNYALHYEQEIGLEDLEDLGEKLALKFVPVSLLINIIEYLQGEGG